MQRTVVRCVRGWLPFGKKTPAPATGGEMTLEQREKLRSLKSSILVKDEAKSSIDRSRDTVDDFADELVDEDAIRARGVAQYTYNYVPPANIASIVTDTVSSVLAETGEKVGEDASIESFSFAKNNTLKYKVLLGISSRLDSRHLPVNGRLIYLKTVADVVDFYSTPVHNTSEYSQLARDTRKPPNLTVIERPFRFHPEDVEAYHGGVTAFPGEGGEVFGLRNKRLYRQFKPKEKWFDYEDQAFDYTRPDENMPWDPEMIKRMDSFADKRYNLQTKKFTRTDSTKGLHAEV